MPKVDISRVPRSVGTGYPPEFNAPCSERVRQRLGNAGGLSDFGVNLMHLPPGNWSSQRHWHSHEDEFIYVLRGELTLVEDGGETVLYAGDCAAFRRRFFKTPGQATEAVVHQRHGENGGRRRESHRSTRRPSVTTSGLWPFAGSAGSL